MLDKHVYAADLMPASTVFSAARNQRKSHYADHNRILKSIKRKLKECTNQFDADSDVKGTDPSAPINSAFVEAILHDFAKHAEDYDASYAEPLSEALRGEPK